MLVFDKTYNYYRQFAKWTEGKIYFVARQKNNAIGEVLETIIDRQLTKEQSGVYKEDKEEKRLKSRRIYRKIKLQPENSFILKQNVIFETKEKYDQYFDLLSQMLIALSYFSINTIPQMDKYIGNLEKMNRYDFRKNFEAPTKNLQEK